MSKVLRKDQTVKYFADEAGSFTRCAINSKNPLDEDWPRAHNGLDVALDALSTGGNVGLLTNDIRFVDFDLNAQAQIKRMGDLANTPWIVRSNAADRVKLAFRTDDPKLAKSTAYTEDGEKHPRIEWLADGRHAMIAGCYNGGEYELHNADLPIRKITFEELDQIWRYTTGGVGIYEKKTKRKTTDKTKAKPPGKGKGDYIDQVKNHWSLDAILEHWNKSDQGYEQADNGDLRVKGNGGLKITDNGQKWYCHTQQVGGGPVELWAWVQDEEFQQKYFDAYIDEMAEAAGIEKPDDKDTGKTSEAKAVVVYHLAKQNCEFFEGTDKTAYASAQINGHTEIMPMNSIRFRRFLGQLYFEATGKIAGASTCGEAIELLSFLNGDPVDVFLRYGGTNDEIYIDLGTPDWSAVKVTSKGWKVVTNPPVKFKRTHKMQALPMPLAGQDRDQVLAELFTLLNVSPADRILVLAYMIAALHPKGPYPILSFSGTAGSAKTTTSKAIKGLIAPYTTATRGKPKHTEDVNVAASNDWLLIFDNLSSIPADVADVFCRLATGGGFSTRELYSNLEEIAVDQQRPIILNGITDLVDRGDLMDRAITVTCEPIPADKRIEESEWDKRFDELKPKALGVLYDLLSQVIAHRGRVKLSTLPRMADFAKIGATLDIVLGVADQAASFTASYDKNRNDSAINLLTFDPIFPALCRFMKDKTDWRGSWTQLHKELSECTQVDTPNFPKVARALSSKLMGIAPTLRSANILSCSDGASKGAKYIKITALDGLAAAVAEVGPYHRLQFDGDYRGRSYR